MTTETDQVKVTSNERAWFTMLPNMVDDLGLDPYQFRLYVHLRRVAGEKGACWQSSMTLADRCKMSTGSISKAKGELVKLGLIKIETKKKNGTFYHHITIVDIWQKNFATFSQSEPTRSPDERAHSPGETKKNHVKNNGFQPPAVEASAQPEGDPTNFPGWNEQIKATNNRQAVLVRMHTALYPATPAPSFSYMAKVAKQVGGASMMAKYLWEFSVRPPVGCVLTFITQAHKGRKAGNGNGQNGKNRAGWGDTSKGTIEPRATLGRPFAELERDAAQAPA